MARKTNTEHKFRRKEKVVAIVDLEGVPAGTPGKIYYEAGVNWIRYHVAFENGVELGNVDGGALTTVADWEERVREERRAARTAAAG